MVKLITNMVGKVNQYCLINDSLIRIPINLMIHNVKPVTSNLLLYCLYTDIIYSSHAIVCVIITLCRPTSIYNHLKAPTTTLYYYHCKGFNQLTLSMR